MIELLISRNANVNISTKDGISSLHFAVKNKDERTVLLLLNNNANVEPLKSDSKYTPLHYAVSSDNQKVVEILVNRGANINSYANDNISPLYIAVNYGYEKIVILLIMPTLKLQEIRQVIHHYIVQLKIVTK